MIDPPVGRPVVQSVVAVTSAGGHQQPETTYLPGQLPVVIGRPVLPLHTSPSQRRAVPMDSDESPRPSQRDFDPWMWIACPLMLVPLILLFAMEADSWPAVDTATETPWLPPSLCSLDGTKYVSYLPEVTRRQLEASDEQLVPTVQRADQQPAGTLPPHAACPASVRSAAPLSFVLPEAMQGWPALGSNVSLVIYHGGDDIFTLSGLVLRDAAGRVLLMHSSPTVLAAEDPDPRYAARSTSAAAGERRRVQATARRLQSSRPGRELKGGGGGGGHGHHSHGGRGGYTTSAHRPATSLPRYSFAPATRTAYGMHTRRAVAAGTAVFIVHHGGCVSARAHPVGLRCHASAAPPP